MSAAVLKPQLLFPDSDGQPMADNTLQFDWIALVKWNVEAQFRDDSAVFVAGDNLIYPNPTDPTERQAPDVYIAFGRPKGYRGSYKLWEEGGLFPQVVVEVWSPNNRADEMEAKRQFYEHHGAEEYYLIYPEHPMHAEAWVRQAGALVQVSEVHNFVSPRVQCRFHLQRGRLKLFGPDGREWKKPDEIALERDRAEEQARVEHRRADAADQRAEAEWQRAEAERQRAEALAEKLRQLGIDPGS